MSPGCEGCGPSQGGMKRTENTRESVCVCVQWWRWTFMPFVFVFFVLVVWVHTESFGKILKSQTHTVLYTLKEILQLFHVKKQNKFQTFDSAADFDILWIYTIRSRCCSCHTNQILTHIISSSCQILKGELQIVLILIMASDTRLILGCTREQVALNILNTKMKCSEL